MEGWRKTEKEEGQTGSERGRKARERGGEAIKDRQEGTRQDKTRQDKTRRGIKLTWTLVAGTAIKQRM